MPYRTQDCNIPLLAAALFMTACSQSTEPVAFAQSTNPALVTRLVELQPGDPLPAASIPPGYK
jgi:hypothetical protein